MAKKVKKRRSSKTKSGFPAATVTVALVALLFGIAFFTLSRNNSQVVDSISVDSVVLDEDDLEIGRLVYLENCASCHGENLEGQEAWRQRNADGTFRAPPHDEDGHTWHHNDDYLLDRIRNGTSALDAEMQAQSNMPAYKNTLTDEEIVAVLGYIKDSWPASIQELQAQR